MEYTAAQITALFSKGKRNVGKPTTFVIYKDGTVEGRKPTQEERGYYTTPHRRSGPRWMAGKATENPRYIPPDGDVVAYKL